MPISLQLYRFVFYLLIYSTFFGSICDGQQRKPTMVGEPLNPSDYENGQNLLIQPHATQGANWDDGTLNDIVEKKSGRLRGETGNIIVPWPNGIVPYLLDNAFTEKDRTMIAKGIQFIETNSCVRIISKTTEENHVLIRKNVLNENCNSFMGMQTGKQPLNLAPRCIERVGSIAHELMHTLGFFHEQSRNDRDDYIIVRYENILEGSEYNFAKKDPPSGNFAGPYDIHSITHYSNTAFTNNGQHTLDPKFGEGSLGQRERLTQLDIAKLNAYYNCSRTKVADSSEFDNEESESLSESSHDMLSISKNTTRLINSCQDYDEQSCTLWGVHGYCDKSPIFMSVYCKKTCGKCDMGCRDANKKCGHWASKNYCDKYSHYMHHYCPFSCWIC